jgi:hypothetical protein
MAAAEIADAVAGLLADETLAGRTLVCRYGQPPRLLPADPWPVHLAALK